MKRRKKLWEMTGTEFFMEDLRRQRIFERVAGWCIIIFVATFAFCKIVAPVIWRQP